MPVPRLARRFAWVLAPVVPVLAVDLAPVMQVPAVDLVLVVQAPAVDLAPETLRVLAVALPPVPPPFQSLRWWPWLSDLVVSQARVRRRRGQRLRWQLAACWSPERRARAAAIFLPKRVLQGVSGRVSPLGLGALPSFAR